MTGQLQQNHDPSARVRALLIAVDTGEYDAETSLGELWELADTAGAEVAATMIQRRDTPDPATCIGAGRLAEAELTCKNLGIELVIFDVELTGSQTANIEETLGVRVIDRTTLILDIFAQRARSAEGRLQVELAQQKYRLPRLTGKGTALSRLGGGIGTRGPGESKLETDRAAHPPQNQRSGAAACRPHAPPRADAQPPPQGPAHLCGDCGLHQCGKVYSFKRADRRGGSGRRICFSPPSIRPARALKLPDGRQVMLIDTVGLVRRLPHLLVEAFRSTLEEAANADLILNVCDISAPDAAEQIASLDRTFAEIGAQTVPVLNVLEQMATGPLRPAGDDRAGELPCLG